MKKCIRCGMVLADQAIRCPQCKYEFKSGAINNRVSQSSTESNSSAFRVLNLNNQKIGVLFPKTCRVIDNNNEPLFIYENGRLKNLKNGMIFTVNPSGTIDNNAGKPVGSIQNYQKFLSIIHSSTISNHSNDPQINNRPKPNNSSQQSGNSQYGPGPLIRKTHELFEKNDIHGALKSAEEAYRLFPNNSDVIMQYASILQIHAYVEEKVVGTDYPLSYKDYCYRLIELCSKMGNNGKAIEMRNFAYYQLGKFYFLSPHKNHELAIDMFRKTDFNYYPYAATAVAHIHVLDERKFKNEFSKDAQMIKQTLNSNRWDGNIQEASAYFLLSLFYSNGAPNLPKDVNYAYSCIQKCASLDPEMAKSEIGKYKKGLFGITYSG